MMFESTYKKDGSRAAFQSDAVWPGRRVCIAVLVVILVGCSFVVAGRSLGAVLEEVFSVHALVAEVLDKPLVLLVVLGLYAVLLATPFLPGAELGLALLVVLGRDGAIMVHAATVIGLMFGFSLGRLMAGFGLTRRRPVSNLQMGLVQCLNARPCLALAVLFNTPGNTLIGGGGGIALAAGLTGLVTAERFFLTVLVSTSPLPLVAFLVPGLLW